MMLTTQPVIPFARKKALSYLSAAIFSILLTGCVSQHDMMVQDGYPLAYADGFDDGCHSGNKAGGSLFDEFKKDINRFNADGQYAQGWTDGFRQCETEQEASQRQQRIAIEQQNLQRKLKRDDKRSKRALERQVQESLKDVDWDALKKLGKQER